jgi:hypothetical protein
MSQRNSDYARKERDFYTTPPWVTETLLPHLPTHVNHIWEPACGDGRMSNVLSRKCDVFGSDIAFGSDFLAATALPCQGLGGIVTNPPYEHATEFCEKALRMMEPVGGFVAMLLRTDFDHAQGRTHLFRDCPAFSKKVVLMKRIVWFVEDDGKPKASPSFNHAWFLWDWRHDGPATLAYAP